MGLRPLAPGGASAVVLVLRLWVAPQGVVLTSPRLTLLPVSLRPLLCLRWEKVFPAKLLVLLVSLAL